MTIADVPGMYVLVEVDGRDLPFIRDYPDPQEPERQCTGVVESDTLTLRKDGTFRQSGLGRDWCDGMPTPTRSTVDSLAGTFALHGPRGDSITMDISALDPPAHVVGMFTDGELRLVDVTGPVPSERTLRYVRQHD